MFKKEGRTKIQDCNNTNGMMAWGGKTPKCPHVTLIEGW